VDSERVRYAGGKRVHDTWRIENDRNGHGKHYELHESSDLASEEEEDRYDPDDAEEQWPEQTLQVGNQTLRTQGHWSHCGGEVSMHNMTLPGSNGHLGCAAAGH
jgi:hypothetical protein